MIIELDRLIPGGVSDEGAKGSSLEDSTPPCDLMAGGEQGIPCLIADDLSCSSCSFAPQKK